MRTAAQRGLCVAAATLAVAFSCAAQTAMSADARELAAWATRTRDNAGAGFVVVDKANATVHVFDGGAHLRASSPVLLGAAHGDVSVPGIGTRPIAEVRPEERTTPAGRFVAERGHNASGEDIVWVDYAASVSMHRVRTTNPKERRLQRLASASVADNRISYGCINVPVAFYEQQIQPLFAAQKALVYVLPESSSAATLFGMRERVSVPTLAARRAERDTTQGMP